LRGDFVDGAVMGIGIVLLFWAVIGTVLATLGGLVLAGATAFVTRHVQRGRKRVIVAAALFPTACLVWAGTVFVFQAAINEMVLQRDPGLGDEWTCPLPNGYALLMIDVTDHGTVFNPKTQPIDGGIAEQDDAIGGVSKLQLAGRYILGMAGEHSGEGIGDLAAHPDSYFLLDTQTGRHRTFSDVAGLNTAAKPLGILPSFEPIESVYLRYRFTWFDVFAATLLMLPPMMAFLLLLRWVWRLRESRGRTAA
jgi:hypothetical protein